MRVAVTVAASLFLLACANEVDERWEKEKPLWDKARGDFAAGTLTGTVPERVPSWFEGSETHRAFLLPSGVEARFDTAEPALAAFLWNRGRNEVWIVHDPSGGVAKIKDLPRMDGVPNLKGAPHLKRVQRLLGRPLFRAEDKGDDYYWVVVE